MSKKVLILGAGYAGVTAAVTLLKKRKKSDDMKITIIDKNDYHTLLTEIHETAGNRTDEKASTIPLIEIFKNTDVEIIKDEVINADFEKKVISCHLGEYAYDYLIIALGSEPNYYGISGMKENSLPLWSHKDALKIKNQIIQCFAMASIEKDAATRKSLLTFAVCGGGFTGVELIGEMANWKKDLCQEYNINCNEVNLVLVEALPRILINLKEKISQKATNYMSNKLLIDVKTNSKITNVANNKIDLADGTAINSHTLIWTAGIRASCQCDNLSLDKGKLCRLVTNEFSQTSQPEVFVIGDISIYEKDGVLSPPIVETAVQTAHNAAVNIICDLRKQPKKALKLEYHGFMVSIGAYYAVAEVMGRSLPFFMAIFAKHLVLMHYLYTIGGFAPVVKHFKNEVYFKKHFKYHCEHHIFPFVQSFWLVPIRLYLGVFWILEAYNKFNDGWLYREVLCGKVVDTISSASVMPIIGAHTPAIMAWCVEKIILPNTILFQTMVIATEFAIGLAFLTGTFVFLASITGIGLAINFALTSGLPQNTWWMIFAMMTVMGGGGRSFGLDYYLIPYLIKQWQSIRLNKRFKLFIK